MLDLRTGRTTENTAIVEMPRQRVKILIAERHVKVGWFSNAVREHIKMERCLNYLEYGYRAR